MGISFGGMVAQELAVTWPERIERLALLCTSPGGAGGSSYPLHELAALDAEDRAATGATLLDTRFTAEWLAAHESDRMLAEMMAARAATPTHRRGAAGRARAAARPAATTTCGTASTASAARPSWPPAATTASRRRRTPRRIAGRVPGAELRIYDGGHAFFAQDPAALPEVLDFLDG